MVLKSPQAESQKKREIELRRLAVVEQRRKEYEQMIKEEELRLQEQEKQAAKVMEKLRKYRFLKSIEKALNAPARPEDVYTTTSNDMYVGDSKPRIGSHLVDPTTNSREMQVNGLVRDLLKLIELMGKRREGMKSERGSEGEMERAFLEVAIRLEELDQGILFTDAEKEQKRERKLPFHHTPPPTDPDLLSLTTQITAWKSEQAKQKRKLIKIETTVRDLGVNVHDARCRALGAERKRAVEGMNAWTERGVGVCRGVEKELRGDTME